MNRNVRDLLPALLALLFLCGSLQAFQVEGLRVGHYVELKGSLEGMLEEERFVVSEVEAMEPDDEQELIGDVERVDLEGARFWVLGQEVHYEADTRFDGLSPEQLLGARVKVEGDYRGPRNFSADEISPRDPGRDRITGRIDRRQRVDGGLLITVMRWEAFVPFDVELESQMPLDELPLAEARETGPAAAPVRTRDDDDLVPPSFEIAPGLFVGVRLEFRNDDEREFDLDGTDPQDRNDTEFNVRTELLWTPTDDFYALVGSRHGLLLREDDQDGYEKREIHRLAEAYGYWRDVAWRGLDLQIGRQDFDEEREWLWDENLDAVRAIWWRDRWKLELSASTVLADGSPRDEASENYIAYLTHGDEDRQVGAYVVDRRDWRDGDDLPIHFGLRALGEWIPDNNVWAELSTVRGYTGSQDLAGWAFDVGTTWTPSFAEPWYLNLGYALGSGDDDPDDGVDRSFRQTGLHDNNGKIGGVTSFRYYGEVVDPELSNMGILTLGIGRRFGSRISVDLVYHDYRQDVAADRIRDSSLDRRPNGESTDLGWGLDLVFGHRAIDPWDFEVILGTFEPGEAFDDRETAWLAAFQVRLRI